MIKKIFLLAVVFLSSPAYGQHVIDDAKIFSNIQIKMLNERARIIKKRSNISVIILTTRSIKTATSIQKQKNHIIIISSMSDRRIYLVSDDRLISDNDSMRIITDHMKQPYRTGRYFDGISNAINYIETKISGEE